MQIPPPGGGYVEGASPDSVLEETPVENILAMFGAIREFGKYDSGDFRTLTSRPR